ncbi:MAG: hypothetical protein KatS3mg059_0948 [Thermomicrobiales bacterium]|nr:MAG: hypothetical protein KatS3mg059_0948 [Thermomicrobiales bacterium]
MVLHDVNDAARVSHRIVAMKDGCILREGAPAEVLDPDLLAELYGVECDVYPHPVHGYPYCVPRSALSLGDERRRAEEGGIEIDQLRAGYGQAMVLKDVSLNLPAGAITAIVGPNACGKSTLLRACARLLKPARGTIRLDGQEVHRGSHRALARRVALLTQGPAAAPGFLVEDLVASGRFPHQGLLRQWRSADEAAVEAALARCSLAELRLREVETLSGGQRQRAWFGMALAQDTPVLLLDEPTTFLDMAAQIGLLDLARALNRREGRTVVMILHDLNLAARYADQSGGHEGWRDRRRRPPGHRHHAGLGADRLRHRGDRDSRPSHRRSARVAERRGAVHEGPAGGGWAVARARASSIRSGRLMSGAVPRARLVPAPAPVDRHAGSRLGADARRRGIGRVLRTLPARTAASRGDSGVVALASVCCTAASAVRDTRLASTNVSYRSVVSAFSATGGRRWMADACSRGQHTRRPAGGQERPVQGGGAVARPRRSQRTTRASADRQTR